MVQRPPGGRPTGRRRLTVACAALVLAASALQGAAGLTWSTAAVDAVGRGRVTVTATGADLVPGLTAVALFALAAVAAAVALAGVARRVLGAALAAVALWLAATVVGLVVAPPTPADLAALPGAPTGGTPVPGSAAPHAAAALGGLGALALLTAGAVLVAARDLPGLGARQRARPAAAAREARQVPGDPDRAAWDALDAGRDPTLAPTAGPDPARTRPERTDGAAGGDTA